jgi:hypothetical protein
MQYSTLSLQEYEQQLLHANSSIWRYGKEITT